MTAARAHFLVALVRPDSGWTGIQEVSERSRAAAGALGAEGLDVRYVRAIFVPEDEQCFLLYEAASKAAVIAATARAGLGVAEVAKAMEAGSER